MAKTCVILICAALLMACASKQPAKVAGNFLETATNHATQDDCARKLGPPHSVQSLSGGGSVWSYRYERATVVGTVGATRCDEYVLTFDRDKILRDYIRKRC